MTKARRGIISLAFCDSSGEMIPQWIRGQRMIEEWHERQNKRLEQSSKNKSKTVQDCDSLSHLLTFISHSMFFISHFCITWTHLLHFVHSVFFETRKKNNYILTLCEENVSGTYPYKSCQHDAWVFVTAFYIWLLWCSGSILLLKA